MALPATDDFAPAVDGTTLTSYSGNWTMISGSIKIYGERFTGDTGGSNGSAYWNADTFDNDQYAEFDVSGIENNGIETGLILRATDSSNWIALRIGGSSSAYIAYVTTANGYQTTGSFTGPTNGQRVRFEVSGTALTVTYDGGSPVYGPTSPSPAIPSSGKPGVWTNNSGTLTGGDNWEGGNLGGTTQTLLPASDITTGGMQELNGEFQ